MFNNLPTLIAAKLLYTKASPPTGTSICSSSGFNTNLLPVSLYSIFSAIFELSLFIPYVTIWYCLFSKYHLCNKSLSLFITAVPPCCKPSSISNLAFKMFFLEPKFPIWAVPTFVITAMVGFAMAVNLLSSPKWFIPISTTRASWSLNPKIVIGIPIWLFILPCVFSALYFCETTLYMISFVLVFPTLPVIAITGMLYFSLFNFAICPMASTVSSTWITNLFSKRFISKSSILFIIAPFAPFFRASS